MGLKRVLHLSSLMDVCCWIVLFKNNFEEISALIFFFLIIKLKMKGGH